MVAIITIIIVSELGLLKYISGYFKFVLPLLMVGLLVREIAVFAVLPNEHRWQEVSYFAPQNIEVDVGKSEISQAVSAYVFSSEFVHVDYKNCQRTLLRYEIFSDEKVRDQLAQCILILDESLKVTPSQPLIWLEKAALHVKQEDIAEFNLSLVNGWRVAKRQEWLALPRLKLAVENWQTLSAENRAFTTRDFLLYAASDERLVEFVARQYLLHAWFKPVADLLMNESSAKVQQQFVAYVRNLAG